MIAGELGYIEIDNYPRADMAEITYTEDSRKEKIELGHTDHALDYEVEDMQGYVLENRKEAEENLRYVRDVMYVLTRVREQWGMKYPFE